MLAQSADLKHFVVNGAESCEPRQNKTCLQELPTRPGTNRPAQPQKLARVLKFQL